MRGTQTILRPERSSRSFHPVFPAPLISLLVFATIASPAFPQNLVSRPAGFVRIEVPSNGCVLASIPFQPFDDAIDSVFAGQLSGATNRDSSDRILQWDRIRSQYVVAAKAQDGHWLADGATPFNMTLRPGDGFWIVSRQPAPQTVFLAGTVVLDATNTAPLSPSLNLFGYPYSSAATISETGLGSALTNGAAGGDAVIDPSARNASPDRLTPGKGYWYDRRAELPLLWVESRPYADLFPTNGGTPRIAGLTVARDGQSAVLTVACEGMAGERLDVFIQDVAETGRFDTAGPWTLAETDLLSAGSNRVQWTDAGNATRPPPSGVFARYYLVGRADVDQNGNGIPDASDQFLFGRFSSSPVASIGQRASAANGNPDSTTAATREIPAGTNAAARSCRVTSGLIVYVDRAWGDDALSGRSPVAVDASGMAIQRGSQTGGSALRSSAMIVEGSTNQPVISINVPVASDGPKQTIHAGLQATDPGGTMVIRAGRYGENLNIAGRDIKVRVEGAVDLSGPSGLATADGSARQAGSIAVLPGVTTNALMRQ